MLMKKTDLDQQLSCRFFSMEGILLHEWNLFKGFAQYTGYPRNFHQWTVHPIRDEIFVTFNYGIRVYSKEGIVLREWNIEKKNSERLLSLSDNNIYLGQTGQNKESYRIQSFTLEGKYLSSIECYQVDFEVGSFAFYEKLLYLLEKGEGRKMNAYQYVFLK